MSRSLRFVLPLVLLCPGDDDVVGGNSFAPDTPPATPGTDEAAAQALALSKKLSDQVEQLHGMVSSGTPSASIDGKLKALAAELDAMRDRLESHGHDLDEIRESIATLKQKVAELGRPATSQAAGNVAGSKDKTAAAADAAGGGGT